MSRSKKKDYGGYFQNGFSIKCKKVSLTPFIVFNNIQSEVDNLYQLRDLFTNNTNFSVLL